MVESKAVEVRNVELLQLRSGSLWIKWAPGRRRGEPSGSSMVVWGRLWCISSWLCSSTCPSAYLCSSSLWTPAHIHVLLYSLFFKCPNEMCFFVLKTFFELMWSKDRRGSFRWIVSVYIEKGPELFFWHRPAALKDNQFIKLMNPCWTPKGELDSAFCFVLLGGCGHWCSGVKRSVCNCCRSGWEQERHSWKHLWSQALHIQLHHFNKVSIFLLVQDPFSVNSLHSSTWPLTFRVQSNWMQTESSWHRELALCSISSGVCCEAVCDGQIPPSDLRPGDDAHRWSLTLEPPTFPASV